MPTITYVGRVADSRKGLPIFLDALELLLSADLPLFRTRIVGGALEETESVQQALHQTDACRESLQAGRIEVWTAVERTALPELYSRSTVVCIPSLREQFGMVAVEAMMCGTPVVASKVGGLQDLVVHNLTGYLVDRLNPPALAAALAQFIRNPSLGSWMGRNALLLSTNRFELDIITRQYIELYEVLMNDAEPTHNELSGLALLRQRMIETHQPTIEQLIGSSVLRYQDVSSSPTPSFVVETKDGKYFVKIHQKRPRSLTCLTISEYNAQSQTIPSQRIKIAQLLSSAPVVPKVISADEDSGIIIQELLSDNVSATEQEAEVLMIEASKQIRSLVAVQGPEAEQFLQALQVAATATEEERAVEFVDNAAAKLSLAILGVEPYLRQCHPQIELIRLASYLRKNSWAVRPEFGARAQSLIRFLISEHSLICTYPYLQHGSMKREHLMRRHSDSTAAVCDLDHAGLYVGSHDIAHWVYDQYARNEVAAPFHMLSQIRRLADTDNDWFLSAVWLAIFPIYDAIWRFAGGNWKLRQWEMQFLTAYPEAFRKVLLSQEKTPDSIDFN
ncbi:MAG: glycosyltransferase [Chitinophagaceae bacterium]|nr:glycosyltransferase [Chitinophagaceae bacterium]